MKIARGSKKVPRAINMSGKK